MHDSLVEQEELAGLHLHVDGRPDRKIIEHVAVPEDARALGDGSAREQSVVARRKELHATVLAVGCGEREPRRDVSRRVESRCSAVSAEVVFLMPDHAARSGQLSEDRASPEQEIGSEQRSHAFDDRRVGADFIERPAAQMVVARRPDPVDGGRREQRSHDDRMLLGQLSRSERREWTRETIALEARELLQGEPGAGRPRGSVCQHDP